MILVSTAIVLMICVFSIVLYLNVEKKLVQNEFENTSKILLQVKYNMDTVDSMIKNMCVRTFFDSDVSNIMYYSKNNIDYSDYLTRVYKISKSISIMNRFVHSLYIYNSQNNKVIDIIKPTYFNDRVLIKDIEEGKVLPKLTPIIREVDKGSSSQGKKETVFTYCMYQSLTSKNTMDGAIIVNVESGWFMDNIKQITLENKEDNICVIDIKSGFSLYTGGTEKFWNSYKSRILEMKDRKDIGVSIERMQEGTYFMTHVFIPGSNIIFVKSQQVAEVYKYISTIKNTILFITILFLIISLLVTLTVSKNIYSPIRNLMEQISEFGNIKSKADEFKDEVTYLKEVFTNTIKKANNYEKNKGIYRNILKSYYLKQLLLGGGIEDTHNSKELTAEIGLTLPIEGYFCTMVFAIDNYENFVLKNDTRNREIIKFSLLNIASEIVGKEFLNEGVDIKDDHVVLIICIPQNEEALEMKLLDFAVQVQNYFKMYFDMTTTVSLSDVVKNAGELPKIYLEAINNLWYRFIFGKDSVITKSKLLAIGTKKKTEYPEKQVALLIQYLQEKDFTCIEKQLSIIILYLKSFEQDNLIVSLIKLTDQIKNALEQIEGTSFIRNNPGFSDILKKLTSFETIGEYYSYMSDCLAKYSSDKIVSNDINPKSQLIVSTAKEIINSIYNDPNLCLIHIADMLKINQRRLGKVFKDTEGISIAEYINSVRLEKAAELLETSHLNVNEIITRVGVQNETYFYDLFKKKYGITPKEYSLKIHINNVNIER
jgi:AraC-like DNA-binding protein